MNEKEQDNTNKESKDSQQETSDIKNGHNASSEENTVDQENEDREQKPDETAADEYADYSEEQLRQLVSEKDQIIEKLNDELKEQQDKALRKTAELDNVKKRSEKERLRHAENAKVEAIEKVLPLREDLQRTLQASDQAEVDEKFLEGVKLVADKFEKVLDEYGVEPIEEEMIPFDVDLHDAMMKQPAQDKNVESNTVLKVVETGYKVGDRVIKHAKVIVSE